MKIIELEQGSKEWIKFRRSHIGASDTSVVMGLNPWRSPLNLWEEKVFGWDQELSDKMREGQNMEKSAREAYICQTGIDVNPLVAECEINTFLSASFDGITKDLSSAVEIKCGKGSHQLAKTNIIPPYYIAQLQHQMMVGNLKEIDYFSYSKKDQFLIKVYRDDEFIKKMIEKEIVFWEYVISYTPPEY